MSNISVGYKLREEIDLEETGHFQPSAVPWWKAYLRPLPQKLLGQSWTGPENFIKIHLFHQFLCPFRIPLHFTSLHFTSLHFTSLHYVHEG